MIKSIALHSCSTPFACVTWYVVFYTELHQSFFESPFSMYDRALGWPARVIAYSAIPSSDQFFKCCCAETVLIYLAELNFSWILFLFFYSFSTFNSVWFKFCGNSLLSSFIVCIQISLSTLFVQSSLVHYWSNNTLTTFLNDIPNFLQKSREINECCVVRPETLICFSPKKNLSSYFFFF
jgi:hypothetical protein